MARKPEIGNVQLYPNRPLRTSDKNGFQLRFFCPLRGQRIRKNCGTQDRREARRIQRECQERLLSGEYARSGGVITKAEEEQFQAPAALRTQLLNNDERTWDQAFEQYRDHGKKRRRDKSSQDSDSRIEIAGRIFEARRAASDSPPGVTLRECTTLDALEYLQDQLLDGAESRYDSRSPNTVNSMLGATLAFVRYCYRHEWIDRVPPLEKISVDDVMRGRPITGEEFDRMLAVVPKIVGDGPAASWQFLLNVLWESGFRIADVMDFSWDDITRIYPVWPRRQGQHPTLIIPSTQKNGKNEEIPMLPGLTKLLNQVPEDQRSGFVVNPAPVEFELCSQGNWFMPTHADLRRLIGDYSNCSIARACGVSEQTVRNWLQKSALERLGKVARLGEEIPVDVVAGLKKHAACTKHQDSSGRLTTERVSRNIAKIGEMAKVIVRQPDKETGRRIKYASAHDLRRSCAERLINAGISAETLMVIMRHKDFATTRKFYGAKRAAQSAATEVHQKLLATGSADEPNRGLEDLGKLNSEQLKKLKQLLNSI
ncbi:MAG: tyrosine-type recombinase/integrase [Planctomycetota bacterium]|nr:tyrosine-type recombinase/integrase [Planctomycetota bacterium]